ncbi:MAG: hypothetical protein ACLTMP_11615 [Eggerthella lenta]
MGKAQGFGQLRRIVLGMGLEPVRVGSAGLVQIALAVDDAPGFRNWPLVVSSPDSPSGTLDVSITPENATVATSSSTDSRTGSSPRTSPSTRRE